MSAQYPTVPTPRGDLGGALVETDVKQIQWIADKVFPVVPVSLQSSAYDIIDRKNIAIPDARRAVNSTYNRVDTYFKTATYTCEEFGLEEQIDLSKAASLSQFFDYELAIADSLWGKMRAVFEKLVKDTIFNTTTFKGASLYTDNSAAPWDNAASDIIGHVEAARQLVTKNSGMEPNTLIVGYPTFCNMLGNTAIKARFPGTAALTRDLLEQMMAAILGVDQIMVGRAVYNSAVEGQAWTGSYIWGDDYAMLCRLNMSGGILADGLGKTFHWTADAPSLFTVETYQEAQTNSDVVRVRHFVDPVITDSACGHLMLVDA